MQMLYLVHYCSFCSVVKIILGDLFALLEACESELSGVLCISSCENVRAGLSGLSCSSFVLVTRLHHGTNFHFLTLAKLLLSKEKRSKIRFLKQILFREMKIGELPLILSGFRSERLSFLNRTCKRVFCGVTKGVETPFFTVKNSERKFPLAFSS